jgi:hypothetical protein
MRDPGDLHGITLDNVDVLLVQECRRPEVDFERLGLDPQYEVRTAQPCRPRAARPAMVSTDSTVPLTVTSVFVSYIGEPCRPVRSGWANANDGSEHENSRADD